MPDDRVVPVAHVDGDVGVNPDIGGPKVASGRRDDVWESLCRVATALINEAMGMEVVGHESTLHDRTLERFREVFGV